MEGRLSNLERRRSVVEGEPGQILGRFSREEASRDARHSRLWAHRDFRDCVRNPAVTPVATPATPISPFYAKRTSNSTPALSSAAKMFREGAEKIVLDKDKQDKLANLIKAVTLQKAQLTEERELAIEGFKAERTKLRGMQHKTLALYSKLRASITVPESLGVADWSDDEDDEDAGSGDALDAAATAMRSMRGPRTEE